MPNVNSQWRYRLRKKYIDPNEYDVNPYLWILKLAVLYCIMDKSEVRGRGWCDDCNPLVSNMCPFYCDEI
jgi:hypothetical protein